VKTGVMKYGNIHKAVFRLRPNRFIAKCELEGEQVKAHVHNTGRCLELLVPGCTVYLEENLNSARKTNYTLISVKKFGSIVNIDSIAPNKDFHEAIEQGQIELSGLAQVLKPETRYSD
jgi:sugar fermentation stimulation protein A